MSKYFLSICAVVRNEEPYIQEWLEFHLLQGISHFYIYENESTDQTYEKLVPYIEQGLVTLINYPGEKFQVKAYQHCLDNYGKETEWVAFLDVDEFLYARGQQFSAWLGLVATIGATPDGIAARWWHYGSNGHLVQKPGLVIERFTRKAKYPDKHVKSIVRPASGVFTGKNPHSFRWPQGKFCVDEHGKKLPEEYAIMLGQSADYICINHYHTKSKQEYFERKKKPDPGSGVIHSKARLEEMFAAHDLNEIEDTYLRDSFSSEIIIRIHEKNYPL